MSKQIINTEQHPGAWLNIVFDFEKYPLDIFICLTNKAKRFQYVGKSMENILYRVLNVLADDKFANINCTRNSCIIIQLSI